MVLRRAKVWALSRARLSRISSRRARHTVASLLSKYEQPQFSVKTLLGHAGLATTNVYSHPDARVLRSAVNALPFAPP